MGRDGIAFTFVVPGEGDVLTSIEQRINKELKRDSIEGFDPSPPAAQHRYATNRLQHEKPKRKLNPMHRKVTRRRR